MIRRAILAGTVAGMTALTIAGPAFAGAALAEPPTPTPTDSSLAPTTPLPDTELDVTITPSKGAPGGTVIIKAVAQEGLVPAHAAVQAWIFDSVTLKTRGNVAMGSGHVRSDAKAGVYPVLVAAMTPDAFKLSGEAQFTVVAPSTGPSPTPAVPAVPRGGVGTGGGGTAGGTNLGLITAGSAIALLGVAAAATAIRRRRSDVRD